MIPGGRAGFDVQPLPRSLQHSPPDTATAAMGGESAWQAERQRVASYLSDYPHLGNFQFLNPSGPAQFRLTDDGSLSVAIGWSVHQGESDQDVLDRHSVTYLGERLAFPQVGTGPLPAHPVMLWWALLFALSMLARYQPDAWAKYVNVSKSPEAIPIEEMLNRALNVLPETIHRALRKVSK